MQDYRIQQANVYTDFEGLNALKTQARTDKESALREVARQFESLFLAEMLKSMRKAGDVMAEGNYLNTNESQAYRDMFDNQISLSMSGNQGTGLADALVRQLSPKVPGMRSDGSPLAGQKATLADYDRSVPPLSPRLPAEVKSVQQLAEALPVMADGSEDDAPLLARFDSPEQFVQTLLPMAQRIAKDSGINPRFMVAQAALETGWGKHMIEGESDSPSYNLFGIKADQRWQGDSVSITTTEFREGVPMKEQAEFRVYADYEASMRDYVDFLESNPRYRDVLAVADKPAQFAEKLQQAGYATDPNYAEKIRSIMNRDSLMTVSMGRAEAGE
ncbi:glucosaminidase [Marinobacter psychrophilus]|jgi:flagellar protein FlgJ|uniref:Peptidoglycan hydrolase FlgJ n=1 Tax=Marinobacter psychrophilus TaxID=330734 RepID=A0A0H4I076_9GAMM|nr:flagellar assembly peptidoglycan hydrolase FlgJ [Marinobacter psychrophilus]AKO52356.1 glucosaminidase [Marinobacter psychrophilus]